MPNQVSRRRRRASIVPRCAMWTPAALAICLGQLPLSSAATSPSLPSPIASRAPADRPFTKEALANFLQRRCGSTAIGEGPAVWSYEGTLTDPTTGRVVAEVEGAELATALPVMVPSDLSDDDGQSVLGGLSARKLLYPTTKDAQWDAAATVLSRRVFCYRRPSSAKDAGATNDSSPYNSLLTSLRLRPDGPLRYLSPRESIAVYDSAVTYVSRNGGREMSVFSERGGVADNEDGDVGREKHFVMGTAQTESSADAQSSSFDFAIHAQRGTLSDSGAEGPLLPPLKLLSSNDEGEEVVISPPRSRLLQFGKGDGTSASDRKYRSVRETYRYAFEDGANGDSERDKPGLVGRIAKMMGAKTQRTRQPKSYPKCSVRYTRYGEAPPWYAPGRSCTLELQGKRIQDSVGDVDARTLSHRLPPLAAWAASKCDFWSGWPAAFTSADTAKQRQKRDKMQQTVALFCKGRQPTIALEDNPAVERNRWASAAEAAWSKMHSCYRRISESCIVSESPRK